MWKLIKEVLKDILTEPSTDDYSFVLVIGLFGFLYGCGLQTMDVIKTGTFEAKDFFESAAYYLLAVGGVYGVYYGIDAFKKKKEEDKL